jgi:hypothetical protein
MFLNTHPERVYIHTGILTAVSGHDPHNPIINEESTGGIHRAYFVGILGYKHLKSFKVSAL